MTRGAPAPTSRPRSTGPTRAHPVWLTCWAVAAFAVMGTSIATCLGVGVLLGLQVDSWWHPHRGVFFSG